MNPFDLRENLKEINELAKSLKPKKFVYANAESINIIVSELGYKPDNLRLNPFIPDGQAIIIDSTLLDKTEMTF